MLKWIAIGIFVAVLSYGGWLYFSAGIPDFTRDLALAAASEPECQAANVVDAMRGRTDTEKAARRQAMALIASLRLDPGIETGHAGQIWKRAARYFWAKLFMPGDELARAMCAFGNAGGRAKNLPHLARLVAGRDLHQLDASEREALIQVYFNELGGTRTETEIRTFYSRRLKQARLHQVGHAP